MTRVFVAAIVALAAIPNTAGAVVLTSPPDAAKASSTPTFAWQLTAGEQSEAIEYTTNPAPGPDGGFADDRNKTFASVNADQTSYTVGNTSPLVAGRWFWHVRVSVPGEFFPESKWSAAQSFTVANERPRIESFKIGYFTCSKRVFIDFGHSDNSEVPPRYAVEFRRRGKTLGRSLGRASNAGLGGTTEYESFRRPRRVRVGRSYFARLVLIDDARHVTKSRPRRVRIERC